MKNYDAETFISDQDSIFSIINKKNKNDENKGKEYCYVSNVITYNLSDIFSRS